MICRKLQALEGAFHSFRTRMHMPLRNRDAGCVPRCAWSWRRPLQTHQASSALYGEGSESQNLGQARQWHGPSGEGDWSRSRDRATGPRWRIQPSKGWLL